MHETIGVETEVGVKRARRLMRSRTHAQRVFAIVPVWVYGNAGDTEPFQEQTHTVQVHANGGVILLSAPVGLGHELLVVNITTAQEQRCQVVSLSNKGTGRAEVEIEFTDAVPRFWNVCFPPADTRPLRD